MAWVYMGNERAHFARRFTRRNNIVLCIIADGLETDFEYWILVETNRKKLLGLRVKTIQKTEPKTICEI